MFETETTQEEYNSQKRVLSLMDYVSPKVFPNDGEIHVIGGNTYKDPKRVHVRSSYCGVRIPKVWILMTKYCYKQTLKTTQATDPKFETCEEVFNNIPDSF